MSDQLRVELGQPRLALTVEDQERVDHRIGGARVIFEWWLKNATTQWNRRPLRVVFRLRPQKMAGQHDVPLRVVRR